MKAGYILETLFGQAPLGQLEPGALRFVAPAQDFTIPLVFLAGFMAFLVLSVATLNYIGSRHENQRASLLALVKHHAQSRDDH